MFNSAKKFLNRVTKNMGSIIQRLDPILEKYIGTYKMPDGTQIQVSYHYHTRDIIYIKSDDKDHADLSVPDQLQKQEANESQLLIKYFDIPNHKFVVYKMVDDHDLYMYLKPEFAKFIYEHTNVQDPNNNTNSEENSNSSTNATSAQNNKTGFELLGGRKKIQRTYKKRSNKSKKRQK
jgi:hypothetical protein